MTRSARFLPVVLIIALPVLPVGCGRIDNLFNRNSKPAYGDVAFKGTPAPARVQRRIPAKPVCHASDLQAAQNDPACVGQVLRASPTSPTITVLEPGLALPPAPMEAEMLDAPK